MAMLPIVAIFLIFQVFVFKMNTRSFGKIAVGILYTYVGLVLFLAGVNVGFFSLGGGAGGGSGYRRNGMAADPAGGAAGLVHHLGGACGGSAGKADRGGQRRRYPRRGH